MQCFAYVFARGGSKGLPGKNLREIGGISLLGRAIGAAKQSRYVDQVIVSTECTMIAAEAKRHGALVPYLRPPELAQDRSSEWLAWRHAVNEMTPAVAGTREPDVFVSVPATAPLRQPQDIDACIEQLLGSSAELVLTVCEARSNPYFSQVRVDRDGLARLAIDGTEVQHRQEAPPIYDITPVAYATRPQVIRDRSGLFDCRVGHVLIPGERAIDIDTQLDFSIAEFLDAKQRIAGVISHPRAA